MNESSKNTKKRRCKFLIKRIISVCLAAVMILSGLPAATAYGASSMGNVTTMRKVKLTGYYFDVNNYRIFYSMLYAGSDLQTENAKPQSVLYDYDPTGAYYEGNWSSHTWDNTRVIRPGERHSAGIGFVVDLEEHSMLGSALKGQIVAISGMNYDNYKGDNDWGAPFISVFDSSGNNTGKYIGEYKYTTDFINNEMNIGIPSGAKYVMFGASGYRRGGTSNKNLDVNLYSLYGRLDDYTKPQVQSIESQNDYIRQNDPEPALYITMSEDIREFSNMGVMLTASDGSTNTVGLEYKGKESFNYSNGDVKYKFRIKIEELINQKVKKNFTKITLNSIKAVDTFGNVTTDTRSISINKRIDTMPPEISEITANSFKASDYFGLSNVGYTLSLGNIKNTYSATNIDPSVTKINDSPNNITIDIRNTTPSTGLFNLKFDVYDLAKNYNSLEKKLFMISDSQPVRFNLMNSNNPMFAYSPEDIAAVGDGGGFAPTNMYLKADISSEYVSGATVYYKWHNTYDQNILTEDPVLKNWNTASFKSNSSETEAIKIPVQKISEGFTSYLKSAYSEGYLYIRPCLDDDTTATYVLRTGSMARNYSGSDTEGNFKLVDGKPIQGIFVNRGCNCTGQEYAGDTPEAHYGAIRSHAGSIGIDIAENHGSLSSIKYFISPKGDTKSYIDQGSIAVNTTGDGKYNIPIDSIAGKTGRYTLTAALYSNRGDVTVRTIDINIESPLISVSNIMYNQATKNLDFTVNYKKDSVMEGSLQNIEIEFSDKDVTEFEDITENTNKISLYSACIDNDWDSSDSAFVRTEFVPDPSDASMMKADFRASLSNMEMSGDSFIKMSGEKRVHLKYTTLNKVEKFNNNITIIKKSNIPPSVTMTGPETGKYYTAAEYNNSFKIYVEVEEPIVELEKVCYKWVNSASTTLIKDGGTIDGTDLYVAGGDKKIQFSPSIDALCNDELFVPKFLLIYAENSAGRTVEKTFGPFYVLNEQINDKRFIITVNDKALDSNHVLIAADDRLHMIDALTKADKMRVYWTNKDDSAKSFQMEYDIDFVKDESISETTNVSLLNIPYLSLSDTEGAGGTFLLNKVEIYNSADKTKILKSETPCGIECMLPQYYANIDSYGSGVNVTTHGDEISYAWSENPYDIPTSWIATTGGIMGKSFYPAEKNSLINNFTYLFIKVHDSIYRSDRVNLGTASLYESIGDVNIKLGEFDGGYYGDENGTADTIIRLSAENGTDLNKICKVEVKDLLSESENKIYVGKLFKISDTEAYGFIKGLVTSGGAISCEVTLNDILGKNININRAGGMPSDIDLNHEIHKRILSIENAAEHSRYALYDMYGSVYTFDDKGDTEIFTGGDYLLVYNGGTPGTFAKNIHVGSVTYSADDIHVLLTPNKPSDGTKIKGPVTATITMPLGSVISDKYGVIENIANNGNNAIATAVVTRSAIYSFDIKFANDYELTKYADINYIDEEYVPATITVTPSAITYTPVGSAMTMENVTASLDSALPVLNNNNSGIYIFDRNGKYSLITREDNMLKEHVAEVSRIDKNCPEPTIKKYVWIDLNNNGLPDNGEKGIEIPQGYTTRHNVIAEITFPMDEGSRPVKLSDESGFIIEDKYDSQYAYKFILTYKPDESLGNQPKLIRTLCFTDTLGNTLEYGLVIDEIDRTNLLVGLNYSTTNFTNSDVVVSMSSNKKIWRYDIEKDSGGNDVERGASPTYVFRENGTKDFNYREIDVTEDPEEGRLTANVTWIDKSVPMAEIQYDTAVTNKDVVISFTIIKGKEQNAKLYCGSDEIALVDSGDNKIGSCTVKENKTYEFEIRNRYGNIGSIFVPISNIDKTAPTISITGREHVYIKSGGKYYDMGATAFDNRDGDITAGINVKNNVNASFAGDYHVVYSATDTAGNKCEKTRYVHVLDINSAVAIVNDNIIDLNSSAVNNVNIQGGGTVFVEFVGINGGYAAKYAKGTGYDNGYFKTNGAFMSSYGTFTAEPGLYSLYVQDQERNTRIIAINFVK